MALMRNWYFETWSKDGTSLYALWFSKVFINWELEWQFSCPNDDKENFLHLKTFKNRKLSKTWTFKLQIPLVWSCI